MTDIIKKTGFKTGVYLGIFSILFSSYIYFYNLKLSTNILAGFLTLSTNIILGIISIAIVKKASNNLITFKEAFSAYFFTILSGSLISCLYLISLYSFILSPETKETIRQTMIDFNINLIKQDPTASQKNIDEAIKLNKTLNPFTPTVVIAASIKYLLRDSLIGLLVASIFRNKRTQQQ